MGYFRALPTGRKCWVTFGPFPPGGSAGLLSGPSYREEVLGYFRALPTGRKCWVTFGPFLPGGSAWGYFRALPTGRKCMGLLSGPPAGRKCGIDRVFFM